MNQIVGHCPKCGAPIYAPMNWQSITPPPSIYSCACNGSAFNTEGDFCMLTDPKKLALHECLHLALAEVVYTAAKLGDDSHELAVAKEHELINRLMMVMS